MLDLTKNNQIATGTLGSLEEKHGRSRVADALRAIELAEKYPVKGGEFVGGNDNIWYSGQCRSV